MDYFCKLKQRYPHICDNDLEDIIGEAKELLLSLLYKSKPVINDKQREFAFKRHEYWLLRCMKEIIARNGIENAVSYSENGISITFDRSQLSKSLIDEIVPFAN